MGKSEVGACKVNVESYKCSIKKITVSTKWKAPTAEVSETVTTTVYDNQWRQWGAKNIYLISSPEGKKVKIKTVREDGKCQREDHIKYVMSTGCKVNAQPVTTIGPVTNPVTQNALANTNNQKQNQNKNQSQNNNCPAYAKKILAEEEIPIKCFEICGPIEAIKYCFLPVPAGKEKNSTTYFDYTSCKEGSFSYKIIPYPDITFQLEVTIGTKEAKKKQGGFSHFERKPTKLSTVDDKFSALAEDANTNLKFAPPKLSALTSFNGKKDELEIAIDFDTDNEVFHFRYEHDSKTLELGSEGIQNIKKAYETFTNAIKFFKAVCNSKFINDFVGFDAENLKSTYSAYTWKLSPPSIAISIGGQYQTSKDLLKIGKFYELCFACEPLIKLSFTIDLLFLILSAVSAGTATGFYVMLKNLDKVIGKILGDDYKKTYKDSKPFEADVYFNLIISGAINGSVRWIVDTTEQHNANSTSSSIEGVLKVDLEAGAKVSVDIFIVAVEGEASASGSTGIKIKFGIENHILQGKGLALLVEGFFLGMKVKYCIKGKAALMKTTTIGGSLVDGDAKLLDTTQIFSKQWEWLK